MTQELRGDDMRDQALIHQFIRVFGRRPTAADLVRYQRAQARLALRLPGRARRRVAQLIARL